MLLIFSEILLVLLINAYEGVYGNCFIFPESVNIKKNVKKFGFHILREIRFFVFYLHQENKKNFVGTGKENTCAILELLEDFIFSDKRSGSCQTTNPGLKPYTVFFIAETV